MTAIFVEFIFKPLKASSYCVKDDEITMTMLKRNNKFYDSSKFGQPQIRVYHKKGRRKTSPRYLLKCGCCDERLEIYYGEDGLEIGGVNGSIEDWREILLPLLLIKKKDGKFEGRKKRKK